MLSLTSPRHTSTLPSLAVCQDRARMAVVDARGSDEATEERRLFLGSV